LIYISDTFVSVDPPGWFYDSIDSFVAMREIFLFIAKIIFYYGSLAEIERKSNINWVSEFNPLLAPCKHFKQESKII